MWDMEGSEKLLGGAEVGCRCSCSQLKKPESRLLHPQVATRNDSLKMEET